MLIAQLIALQILVVQAGSSLTIKFHFHRAVSLILQVALPCLLFSPNTTNLTLRGGTNAEMAPQIDYTTSVLQPILEKFGIQMDCNITTR